MIKEIDDQSYHVGTIIRMRKISKAQIIDLLGIDYRPKMEKLFGEQTEVEIVGTEVEFFGKEGSNILYRKELGSMEDLYWILTSEIKKKGIQLGDTVQLPLSSARDITGITLHNWYETRFKKDPQFTPEPEEADEIIVTMTSGITKVES